MPIRSKKPCKKIGCKNLAQYPHMYCDGHKELEEKDMKEREEFKRQSHKEYKSNRQDKDEQSFYKSKRWEAVRKCRLVVDNGLCQECLREGKLNPSNTVHHKIEIKVDWNKRFDLDNLITVCEYHHNKIHNR